MGKWMNNFLEKFDESCIENMEGGGKDRIEVQHHLGKLTARERIAYLVDPGSFMELGSRARDTDPFRDPAQKTKPSPADGVVMGLAKISGRQVVIYVTDYTVMSGSLGNQGVWKISESVEIAGRIQVPLIGIIDSAGSRIGFKSGHAGLHGLGRLVRNYCLYSGIIPQITLLLGPCTGPLAQIPALSDFLIVNQSTGFLWLGGEVKTPGAGSAQFHMTKSGQCDLVADSDQEVMDLARQLIDFLPQNCWEKNVRQPSMDDPHRREEELLEVMPDNPKFTYDMHEIIDLIVDDGKFFELKEDYASNLIIGFALFDGIVTGIAASNPEERSGVMEPDSSDKYDKFLMFLDAFNIPLLTISDTTGYPPGDKWERMGVIRHGAKNLHGYSHLTNPKVTVVLRRSYGGSNISMGCSKMGPDFIFGWPTVEFAPTGPDAIVQAIFHKELSKAKEEGNYEAVYKSFLDPIKKQYSVMNMAKSFNDYYTVHEIIDPRDTRTYIVNALNAAINKREKLPGKKRYVKPA